MATINTPNYPYSAVADDNTDFSGNARASSIDDLFRLLAASIANPMAVLFANDGAINAQLEGLPDSLTGDKFLFSALSLQTVEVGQPVWISAVNGSALTASTEIPEGRLPQAFALGGAAAGSIAAFTFVGRVILSDLTGFSATNNIVYLEFTGGSWELSLTAEDTGYRVGVATQMGTDLQVDLNFVGLREPRPQIATADQLADGAEGILVDADGFNTAVSLRLSDQLNSLRREIADSAGMGVSTWALDGNTDDVPVSKIPSLPGSIITSGTISNARLPRPDRAPNYQRIFFTGSNPYTFAVPEGVVEYEAIYTVSNTGTNGYTQKIIVAAGFRVYANEASNTLVRLTFQGNSIQLTATGGQTATLTRLYWK